MCEVVHLGVVGKRAAHGCDADDGRECDASVVVPAVHLILLHGMVGTAGDRPYSEPNKQ